MAPRFGSISPVVKAAIARWRAQARSFVRNPVKRTKRLSLVKRVQLKRFLKKQARRIYRAYDTNEAVVYFVRRKGKRCIFRDGGETKGQAMIRYFAHLVLHEAFPENNIHPLGIEVKAHNNWKKKHYGLVSFPVQGRNKSYKRYQWWDYLHRNLIMVPDPVKPQIVLNHENFVNEKAVALAEEMKQKTGIGVSVQPANVMDVGGKPVFVEYNRINVPELLGFLRDNPAIRERVFKQLFPSNLQLLQRMMWLKWVQENLEYTP